MKKLFAAIVTAFLFGLVWNYTFNYYLMPDFRFWTRCAEASDTWAQKLRVSPEPCYVFTGGSETRTTVDPQQLMDEYGVRAINAAEQAGYGGICNAEVATPYLRKGDTLVISLSGYNLSVPPTKPGIRFAWNRMKVNMFADGMVKPTYKHLRTIIAGDSGSLALCIIKSLLSNEPVCHFDRDAVIHPSGWMEVRMNDEWNKKPAPFDAKCLRALPESHLEGFRHLEKVCQNKGAQLLLMVHLTHAVPEMRALEAFRALKATRNGFRVLKDERLGSEPMGNLFAETGNHQNAAGVRRHMHIIGHSLKHQLYWTEGELIEELHRMGWKEDGTKL